MLTSKSSSNEVLESQKTVSPGGDESGKGSLFLDRPAASSSISSYSNISPDDTGAVSGGDGGDLESQQTVLSMASIAPGADKADKASLALDIVSSRTSNISQDDSGETAVKISNYCIGDAKLQQANIALTVEEDLDSMQKVGGIQEIAEALDTDLEKGIPGLEQDLCCQRIANTISLTQAPARNHWQWIVSMLLDRKLILKGDESEEGSVALDNVSPSDTREAPVKISNNCIGDAKLQQANIALMVKEDLDSMQKFGGIQEIAEALDTDLEKGIPGLEQDLCSQRISKSNTLSQTQARARNRWQWIVSMLRDRKGDESEKGSVALDNLSASDTGEADLEISSASAQVSITVNLDGENDNCICDVKLQQANIAKMVKEKNFDSIQNFGGIQRIAEALGTDLEKGIPGLKQDPCTQHIDIANSSPSITQAPARGCFKSLLKTCNDWIIFLLFVYAMLLLGFGIVMKSPKDWQKGVITILFIMVLVIIHSLRELWLERSRQMSRRQNTSEMHQVEVEVIRWGSSQKVFISDVLLGDIVCLEWGSLVPADGLLVSGEYIKLDDDLDSIINNENPFLFYGPKVIDGKGRMLVTSVGMNTTILGDLLNKVTYGALNKTPLPVQLDKLNTGIQITGLLLSILNLVVLFFHFMLQKKRFHFNLPDLKGKAVASKEIMDTSKKIFLTPNGKFNTLSTSILTFLFGVTEGIPFVVILAIGYWNKKMLFGKATVQEPLACLTMNSVTTVCIDKSGWRSLNPVEVDMDSTRGEIEAWINAGVNIILISEDSVSILEDIASEYGLLPNADKLKLEAKEFRNYTNKKRMDEVDKIILMGSLIPSDKLLLVQCLKKKGHTVAMVGVSSNVIPALKEADVRITIQTCSSEMVRESCNITIVDGNLGVLVSLVRCGRCSYDNICKYLQLELTMNIAGLLITFITTTIFGYSPITTIQLAWANFVVTLLGGLGLLTGPPSKKLMEKPPLRKTEPLINMTMWSNVVIQALYQSGVSVTWQFKGQTMIGINKEVSNTIIFNSFVLCQVCNIINARQVRKMNVVEHFPRNPLFWLAVGVILLLQVTFIEITHILAVLAHARLTLLQWFICLSAGMVSWVINCLLIGLQSACTS
ncbi:hypothetical protein SO802_007242 [Lithocarpus litseifolius]|uniref:Cation-transporting P-type ATPase C-terminal domain-containing protein n=1 Tax=Lithocarpus litseifolius TaxID=425828 RepID=A0AAW2DPT2_9ROSI